MTYTGEGSGTEQSPFATSVPQAPQVPQAAQAPQAPQAPPGYGAPPPVGHATSPPPQPGTASFGPDDFPMREAAPVATAAVEVVEEEEREPNLAAFLESVIDLGGSDLHLTSGLPPMVRVHGDLRPIKGYRKLFPQDLQTMIYSILTQRQRERFETDLELDVSYSLPGKARFRVNVFQQRDALGSVMRLIPFEIKTLETLGLPQSVHEFARMRRGLVLVTGVTGSGKSTTLAGLIDIINSSRPEHIMTVEDPIEFLHRHKTAIINQREVGTDTYGFANALKHVLRQDPDVILVGELRDLETISMALTAAETGHLVFATLHTQDAPQSVDRVIDVFPPHQQEQIRVQLAGTLAGIVSQQLIPTSDGKGRAVAAEVLVATPAVRNLIREGKTHQIYTSMQAGGKFGMQVMDQHLAELVKKGKVSYEMGLERAHHVEEYNRLTGRG
ncbi:MAG: type IV pilus twitching motility protein PilT [Actinomycetota bacterium]|nr:type IV pilus twitching motility protein PilT [Actinomycetota bacterium]